MVYASKKSTFRNRRQNKTVNIIQLLQKCVIQLNFEICKKIWCNKNCFKTAIQKTSKAFGTLIGNKIEDKNTSASKSSKMSHLQNNLNETNISKEKYISSKKKTTHYWWITNY